MGYQDYMALMELLEDLEAIRDMLESEAEPARPLREYTALDQDLDQVKIAARLARAK